MSDKTNKPPWPKKLRVGAEVLIKLPVEVVMPFNAEIGETPGEARFGAAGHWFLNVLTRGGARLTVPADSVVEVIKKEK